MLKNKLVKCICFLNIIFISCSYQHNKRLNVEYKVFEMDSIRSVAENKTINMCAKHLSVAVNFVMLKE